MKIIPGHQKTRFHKVPPSGLASLPLRRFPRIGLTQEPSALPCRAWFFPTVRLDEPARHASLMQKKPRHLPRILVTPSGLASLPLRRSPCIGLTQSLPVRCAARVFFICPLVRASSHRSQTKKPTDYRRAAL